MTYVFISYKIHVHAHTLTRMQNTRVNRKESLIISSPRSIGASLLEVSPFLRISKRSSGLRRRVQALIGRSLIENLPSDFRMCTSSALCAKRLRSRTRTLSYFGRESILSQVRQRCRASGKTYQRALLLFPASGIGPRPAERGRAGERGKNKKKQNEEKTPGDNNAA